MSMLRELKKEIKEETIRSTSVVLHDEDFRFFITARLKHIKKAINQVKKHKYECRTLMKTTSAVQETIPLLLTRIDEYTVKGNMYLTKITG